MCTLFVNHHGCVLSAYNINATNAVEELQIPAADVWNNDNNSKKETRFAPLVKEATKALTNQGFPEDDM